VNLELESIANLPKLLPRTAEFPFEYNRARKDFAQRLNQWPELGDVFRQMGRLGAFVDALG
jgi:hypothetical protein